MKRFKIISVVVITSLTILFASLMLISSQSSRSVKEKKDEVKTTSLNADTVVDVNGKRVLFIGDSHTANHNWGWQLIVSQKTGMVMKNTAVVGKHLPWMVSVARQTITPYYHYCFIYGGANDIHGNRNPYSVVKDVQKIVDICAMNGVEAIVLTGFNAEECVRPLKGQEFYPKAYTRYQKILMDSIVDATVVDTRVVVRTDCGDWTCHMNPSGHKKVANAVIKQMKFKIKN
jgi:uncharacterized Zn-binding protein involved in type VI secretion